MHAGKRRLRVKKKKRQSQGEEHTEEVHWLFPGNGNGILMTSPQEISWCYKISLRLVVDVFSLNRKGTRAKRTMRGEKVLPSPKPCDFGLLSIGERLCRADLAKKFSGWWAAHMLQPPKTWLTRVYACNNVSGVLSLWVSSFFLQILDK